MVKAKNEYFKIYFFVVLFVLVFPFNVYAAGSGYPGITGSSHPCNSGKCYDTRVGMRLTLVYGPNETGESNVSEEGKRCNYDSTGNTICSDDGIGTGSPTKSIDIWFTPSLVDMGDTQAIASSKKMSKKEFVDSIGSFGYGSASSYYTNDSYLMKEISSLSFLGSRNSNDLMFVLTSDPDDYYSSTHVNNFTNDFLLPMIQIDAGAPITSKKWNAYSGKNPTTGELSTIPILNELVSLMTNGALDFESVTDKTHVYIEFDQLIQYGYYLASGNKWQDSVIGTVAEVTYYWKNKSKNQEIWCVSDSSSDLVSDNVTSCSDAMVRTGYTNGWYAQGSDYNVGGVTVHAKSLGLGVGQQPAPGQSFESFYQKDTKNVAYYWLNNPSIQGCASDDELKDFLNNGPGASNLQTLIEKFELKYVSDPTVKIKYLTPTISGIDDRLSRMNEFVINLFEVPKGDNIAEACYTEMNCNDIANNIYQCYKRGKNNGKAKYNGLDIDVDLGTKCSSHGYDDPEYVNKLKELATIYGLDYDTSMLNKTVYSSVGKTKPSCGSGDPIPPECKVSVPPISCGNKFTFKDASDKDKCWGVGIAYQTDSGATATSLEQVTEKDDASCVKHGCSGSHECKTYCYEEVEFDFPSSPSQTTKAGQVFKWGVDDTDKSKNVFGTMTVTKKCTSNSKGNDCTYHSSCVWHCHKSCRLGGCCSGKTDYASGEKGFKPDSFTAADWKDDVETEVKLIYKEPTSTELSQEQNLILKWKEDDGGSYSPGTCTNSDCSNDGIHSMSNTYEFLYPEELNWSSYKVDNSLKANVSDTNYYYHIGYGLPTAFTTPTGTYGPTGTGELTARITNIGAKQKMESGYRYDKLINGDDIDYSCEFKIYNQLYDYECCDEAGNLKPGAPSYCDPNCKDGTPENKRKGIDVVFRTIELMGGATDEDRDRAFPGKVGSGRTARTNWYDLYSEINELYKVLDGSVYSKDPQYEIKLTVKAIQNIRKENKAAKSAGIDPYTEMNEVLVTPGPGNTGFICYDSGSGEQYKYCASSFLSSLTSIDPNPENNLKGTCIDEGGSDTSGRAAYFKTTGCHQS